jgi:surfactin synthase thioesterase subunit
MDSGNGSAFFILSHASGSGHHYLEGFQNLGRLVELVPMDLPGHGKRKDESLLYSMEEIVGDLAREAAKSLSGGRDYYVLGHSMGALNGFLMADALIKAGFRSPKRLFMSSYSTPGWHPIPPGMSKLPDLEMWKASALHFGVLNNQPIPTPEQMELFSPVYRADLVAVEKYFQPDPIPVIDAPITAVYAESDMVNQAQVEAWRGWSTYPVEIIRVPGGHFHPLERPAQLEAIIMDRL